MGRPVRFALAIMLAGVLAQSCGGASDIPEGPGTVEVDGVTFAYHCQGSGTPIVISEGGFTAEIIPGVHDVDIWFSMPVGIEEVSTVCAYGRRGVHLTDPLTSSDDRLSSDHVADLKALIDAVGWKGPFILMGHSYGGMIVRLFADTYPDMVTGLLFVDSSSPDQGGFGVLPQEPEFFNFFRSADEVAAVDDLGDLPIIVLSRGSPVHSVKGSPDGGLPPMVPLYDDELAWEGYQEDIALLSTDSEHIVLDDAGHMIHFDRPDAISDALQRLIDKS